MKLSLIALLVRDYDEAIDWYRDVLGFQLAKDEDQGGGGHDVQRATFGDQRAILQFVSRMQMGDLGKTAVNDTSLDEFIGH